MKEGDFLVVDPKPEHVDGLAIGRPQWLLRPGDLVPVNFLLEQTPWGFYIPVDAITTVEDKHAVFVVEKDAAENDVATLKDVDVHETFREWRRISGADVTTGVRVIVRGVHYLSDGQRVSVTGEENIPR